MRPLPLANPSLSPWRVHLLLGGRGSIWDDLMVHPVRRAADWPATLSWACRSLLGGHHFGASNSSRTRGTKG